MALLFGLAVGGVVRSCERVDGTNKVIQEVMDGTKAFEAAVEELSPSWKLYSAYVLTKVCADGYLLSGAVKTASMVIDTMCFVIREVRRGVANPELLESIYSGIDGNLKQLLKELMPSSAEMAPIIKTQLSAIMIGGGSVPAQGLFATLGSYISYAYQAFEMLFFLLSTQLKLECYKYVIETAVIYRGGMRAALDTLGLKETPKSLISSVASASSSSQ